MIWVLGNPQYMLEKTLIFGNLTRPNIKNPYSLGTDASSRFLYANLKKFYSKIKHFVRKFCRKICSMISTYFFVSFDILQIMPEILTYLPVNLVDLIPSILTASIGYNSLSHNTLPSHGMENLEDGKDKVDFIFEDN